MSETLCAHAAREGGARARSAAGAGVRAMPQKRKNERAMRVQISDAAQSARVRYSNV